MAKESYMHGGFFSPTGYFKVETGGTHDENPNGGVQIGVDDQGIPNMLEEGEPVYNDYVYSDNIRADKEMLKQFNLPEKYAGKLYSEIADAYVDEAEDRPLDTISNNGLRVMLGRLAQAQEKQKQSQEEKELEDELANLSPEELAELENMLAGQQQMPVEQKQMIAPGMMQQPMIMAMGGKIDGLKETKEDALKFAEVLKNSEGKLMVDVKQIPAYYLGEYNRGNKEFIDNIYNEPSKEKIESARLQLLKRAEELSKDEQKPKATMAFGGAIRRFDGGSRLKKYDKPDYIKDEYSWLDGIDLDRLLKEAELLKIDEDELNVDPIKTTTNKDDSIPTYATWPRYMGPIGHGLLALRNAVTPPTDFTYQSTVPETFSGGLNLTDMTYRPVPIGLLMDQTLASGAGTMETLRNSGLGASLPAAVIAADKSLGQNIGNTLLSVWQANNDSRNNVIQSKNVNREKEADIDYRIALANAGARERAMMHDSQYDLLTQRLNDESESGQFGAISNELGYALQGVAGIGDENFNRNMANSVYPYKIDQNGRVRYYKPAAFGGLLKVYRG